ncbi:MAG: GNAT family N-acetyltransferase [Ignavibacteriales bacterium]|nr:MAG: GNAT family N-acetyltransferase [Ignavibacteriales bacterium]
MINFSENIVLENRNVLLRPTVEKDLDSLKLISTDNDIWKYTTNMLTNEVELKQFINSAIDERNNRNRYTFIIFDKKIGEAAGSTAYGNISTGDKRLEIGWTWLGIKFQGTGLNKNVKFLMLQYAFEKLGCERVEFKTDVLNLQSRKALLNIGAVEEGILRSHTQMHSSRRRDTIYFSILKNEWEKLKNTTFDSFNNN